MCHCNIGYLQVMQRHTRLLIECTIIEAFKSTNYHLIQCNDVYIHKVYPNIICGERIISFYDALFIQACYYNQVNVIGGIIRNYIDSTVIKMMFEWAVKVSRPSLVKQLVLMRRSLLNVRVSTRHLDVITVLVQCGYNIDTFSLTPGQVCSLYGHGIIKFGQYTLIIHSYVRQVKKLLKSHHLMLPQTLVRIVSEYTLHDVVNRDHGDMVASRYAVKSTFALVQ